MLLNKITKIIKQSFYFENRDKHPLDFNFIIVNTMWSAYLSGLMKIKVVIIEKRIEFTDQLLNDHDQIIIFYTIV